MKILISYLTGIGNTILFLPTLRVLHQHFPEAAIDVLVRHQASKEILDHIGCCRNVYTLNSTTPRTLRRKLHLLYKLRRERYDVNMTAFPANRMAFHALSFFFGATRRIAHRYQVGYYDTLGFLQNAVVDTNEEYHDIDQNLALLTPLGINTFLCTDKQIGWESTPEETAYAEKFFNAAGISSQDVLIGFHPGCNPAQGNILKRWPPANFAQLGNALTEQLGTRIILFGDQQETALKEEIRTLLKSAPLIPENLPLLTIAALIKRCRLFVTNDSGLMHVAAAMGVPTVSLFGPSDPGRNAPHGEGHAMIRANLPCIPCNKYPLYQHGGSYVRCIYRNHKRGLCMQGISVERVYDTIMQTYAALLMSSR